MGRVPRTSWPRHALVIGLLVALLFGGIGPTVVGSSSAQPETASVAASTVEGTVLWNGQNVSTARGASSAIAITFEQSIDVRYFWNATRSGSSAASVTMDDARLQMFYFGQALATRDVYVSQPVPAAQGNFDLSWDPGALQWVLEGVFAVTASLLDVNGTTVWSETFYVRATAPYSVGAAVPILLIFIGAYELYALAVSGRQASRRPPKPEPSPPGTGASAVGPSPPEAPAGPSGPPPGGAGHP